MTAPTTTTTEQPAVDQPNAAVIELLERHKGTEKYPRSEVLVPNFLRIDGVAIYASQDHPVVVEEIEVDGLCRAPFTVTVRLLARALRIGGGSTDSGPVGGPDECSGAVVEVPVGELIPGAELKLGHVVLNGKKLYVRGPVKVGRLVTGGSDWAAAEVTLTLPCRRLVVDDEPTGASGS